MTLPTNTYTVTFSDAHAHTLQFPAVPAAGGNIMAGKMDALRNVLLEAADNAGSLLSVFTATDTLTVTITQPWRQNSQNGCHSEANRRGSPKDLNR